MKLHTLLLLALMTPLAACELLGIPDPAKEALKREAEGKAIGSACRHAGRALEDCFTLNPKAEKAAIFAGWKEMNDYMAENKIEIVKPELEPGGSAAKKADDAAHSADAEEDTEASGTKAEPEPKAEPKAKPGKASKKGAEE